MTFIPKLLFYEIKAKKNWRESEMKWEYERVVGGGKKTIFRWTELPFLLFCGGVSVTASK